MRDFPSLYLIICHRCRSQQGATDHGGMHARLAGCDDGRGTDLYASFLSATSSSHSIPLPPSVRVLPATDEENTRSPRSGERDPTSRNSRSQWDAVRGCVFFFFLIPRPAAHAGRAVQPVRMHSSVRLLQELSVRLECQSGRSGERQDSAK